MQKDLSYYIQEEKKILKEGNSDTTALAGSQL
jgi:hypothetical protein